MIINEELQKRIDFTLNYLKNTNLDKLETGKHNINDWLYINVQEYETKDISLCKYESHKKYIDIQYMINGIEAIEIADIEGQKLDMANEYNEEQDVIFWFNKPNQMKTVLTSDSYVILYPQNAHKPCIAIEKPTKVKKLVAKINCYK